MVARNSSSRPSGWWVALPVLTSCNALLDFPPVGVEDPFVERSCLDGVDNDLDGKADCDDLDCAGCCPEVFTGACNDARDNDGDGAVDYLDVSCWADADFPLFARLERCATTEATQFRASFIPGEPWRGAFELEPGGGLRPLPSGRLQAKLEQTIHGAWTGSEVALALEGNPRTLEIEIQVASGPDPNGLVGSIQFGITTSPVPALFVQVGGGMTRAPLTEATAGRWRLALSVEDRIRVELRSLDTGADTRVEAELLPTQPNPSFVVEIDISSQDPNLTRLLRLDIDRPAYDPCGTPIPTPTTVRYTAVHGVALSALYACALVETDERRIEVIRRDLGSLNREWSTTSTLGVASQAVIAWSETRASFIALQMRDDGRLTLHTNRDCFGSWNQTEADWAGLEQTNVEMGLLGLDSGDDFDDSSARVYLALRTPTSNTIDIAVQEGASSFRFRNGDEWSMNERNWRVPDVTATSFRDQLILLVPQRLQARFPGPNGVRYSSTSRGFRGDFEFSEFSGCSSGGHLELRAVPFLAPTGRAGSFDAQAVTQAAMALDARRGRAVVLYAGQACSACPRQLGEARTDFLTVEQLIAGP